MKYALVTGGSRGIGRAVCVKLASLGYHVLINYVSNEAKALETKALTKEAGEEGEIIKFDVANLEETTAAIEKWQNDNKDAYIDVLVNNAGVTADSLLPMMEPEAWHKVLSTSLDGFFNVTRTVIKKMVRKKTRTCNQYGIGFGHNRTSRSVQLFGSKRSNYCGYKSPFKRGWRQKYHR